MGKHWRSHSEVCLRQAFAPVFSYDIEKWEQELRIIETSALKSNRKIIGSLLGASIVFITVFLNTDKDIVYGMIGALIGLCVGYMIGRKIPGKNIRSNDLDKITQYQLKLTCSLIYLRKLRKEQIHIDDFSSLLEKILDDFRPALNHSGKHFSKQINELNRVLRKNTVHVALLNALIELNNDIESDVLPYITGVRILRFFIPVMEVLKSSDFGLDNELEIVKKIEDLLSQDKVKKMLAKISNLDEELIKYVVPYTAFASKQVGKHGLLSKNLSIVENFLRLKKMKGSNEDYYKAKRKFSEKLRFRKLSLAEINIFEKKRTLFHADLTSLKLLFESYKAFRFFQGTDLDELLFKTNSISEINFRRSIFRNPTVAVVKKRQSVLFEGNLLDLHAGMGDEDQEDSILLPLEHQAQKKRSRTKYDSRENKTHKFQECFDFLLAMEKQPKPEVIWKKVIQRNNFQVFVQKNLGSIISIRAYCNIKYNIDVVVKALWDPDIRIKWDSFLQKFEVVERKKTYEVVYIVVKTPSAIAKRDIVQKRMKIENHPEDGTVIMHFISIEHQEKPVFDEFIRAETITSGYILRYIERDLTEFSIISKTNVKGIIPIEMFVKLASKSPETWLEDLKKGCEMLSR